MCQGAKYLRGDGWRLESRSATGWSSATVGRTTAVEVETPLRISETDNLPRTQQN